MLDICIWQMFLSKATYILLSLFKNVDICSDNDWIHLLIIVFGENW